MASVKTVELAESPLMGNDSIQELDFIDESPLIGLSALTLGDIEEPLLLVDDECIEDESEVEIPPVELERYDDAIKIYLRDIQRTPLLSASA